MKRLFFIAALSFGSFLPLIAQNGQYNNMHRLFNDFRNQAKQQYDDYRNQVNRQYAEFMRQAWQQYKTLPAIPKPKDDKVKPVTIPEKDRNKPIESKPVEIEEIIVPPMPGPQPVPVAPIKEQQESETEYVAFSFYGTECKVRVGDAGKIKLKSCDGEALAKAWERFSDNNCNNIIRDCLELRIRLNLCDWAYLNMLQIMAEAVLGQGNEATLLTAFVYCQSGYKMRLGTVGNKLYLLYASEHTIYGQPYFEIDGGKFYPFHCMEERIQICQAAYPKEQALSLQMLQPPSLKSNKTADRMLMSERYPDMTVQVGVNRNLLDFYDTYPSSEIGNNFMTRWAIYANTPMDEATKDCIYPGLREKIRGLDKKEATERLLNFVQTAFVYEYDEKVWGHDRAFFTEETLYYPYCDCEDRSILFSRLVRDLLGLDVILVYYPGHLATAVCFDDNVNGDYIMLNSRKFIVCDPTYIGAGIGLTMPDMDNLCAKVILLDKIL